VASGPQLAQALTVAGRVAREDPAVCGQLRDLLDQRLGDLLQRVFQTGDGELLTAVVAGTTISEPAKGAADAADRFPDTLPFWLRPLAATITGKAANGFRRRAAGGPTTQAELARLLSIQSGRLAQVGRREDALTVATEAVTIDRQLAQASPDAYLPGLAASLTNQANRLAEVGRLEAIFGGTPIDLRHGFCLKQR
jgi:hypothetical protein